MIRYAMTALMVVLATSAHGQVYKWVDKDGKVRYSDQPPPRDAAQKGAIANPSRTAPPAAGAGAGTDAAPADRKGPPTQASFRPEEQAALRTICAIALVESFACQMKLKRMCPIDEMVAGVGGEAGKGLRDDPRLDANYEYRVQPRGDDVTISAIPRTAGLTGFIHEGDGTRFKPNGPARGSDQKVEGGLNCAGMSKS